MARTSGAELDSPRQTAIERFGSAVAESTIPECLAPDESGSLLSAPLIAIQALRGKWR